MFVPYRNSHVGMHHRYFGDVNKDPDYRFHLLCGLYDSKENHTYFITKNLVLALVGYRSIRYIIYVIEERIFFKSRRVVIGMPIFTSFEKCLFGIQWALILVSLFYFKFWTEFLLFWLIYCFTTAVAIGWCAELAEHSPPPQSENKTLLMTRNRHGWAIERFIFGRHNDNYHLVHHIYPSIPFYNLKRAHKVLLGDPAYHQWDAVWGGIFSRNDSRQETLISYIKKYRAFVNNSETLSETTFGERFVMEHGVV